MTLAYLRAANTYALTFNTILQRQHKRVEQSNTCGHTKQHTATQPGSTSTKESLLALRTSHCTLQLQPHL